MNENPTTENEPTDAEGVRSTVLLASDVQQIIREYGHPISMRVVIAKLAPVMESTINEIGDAVSLTLSLQGWWIILIGEDNGLIGLDEDDKPGDGSEAAAAEYLDLVKIGAAAYVPASFLNG